ncbi:MULTISPECIES: AAA family ATPase [Mumia]|uniref:AAA family ATPase n=1 Tax=Mumia TaxID=1546255 RepID=UPI001421C5A6|nr:hypothetical protein [Mumia sp. ZJ1417]QMW65562.1 hypothetical protein H4N58_15425 [Mumia sp. ZJ1417]
MSVPVLIAAGDAAWEAELVSAAVEARGITVVRRCVDVADAVATAVSGAVALALVSVELPGLDPDAVERIARRGVVVVAIAPDAGMHEAARIAAALGIEAVVPLGRLASVVALARRGDAGADPRPGGAVATGAATEAASATGFPLDAPPREGRLTAVWGPAGSPGRSTVARGLAAELAARGRRTVLVDADVDGGTQAAALALLDEVSGLLAAARDANGAVLSTGALAGHLRWIGPELGVLTGLPRAERWPGLRATAYEGVLATARDLADDVVVDLGFCLDDTGEQGFDGVAPRRTAVARHTLATADEIVLVGLPDPVGLSRLARAVLDLRARCDVEATVVVNQMRSTLGWSTHEVGEAVERFTGVIPTAFLPYDRTALDHCLVHGLTSYEGAAGSAFQRAVSRLADDLGARAHELA